MKQLKVLAAFGNTSAKQITGNLHLNPMILRQISRDANMTVTIAADFSKMTDGDAADEQVLMCVCVCLCVRVCVHVCVRV